MSGSGPGIGGSGRIAERHAVASVAGVRGLPGAEAYCASKAALLSYAESVRVWLHGEHLRAKPLEEVTKEATARWVEAGWITPEEAARRQGTGRGRT